MNLEPLKLQPETLNRIEGIIHIAPRTGIEALLVTAGTKTGDAIGLDDRGSEYSINVIKNLPNIEIIKKPRTIFYCNIKIADKAAIDYMINETDNAIEPKFTSTRYYGRFYGFEKDCIEAYIQGTCLKEIMPATEHLWCSKNCLPSILMQEANRKAVRINLPQYAYLLELFGELPTYAN